MAVLWATMVPGAAAAPAPLSAHRLTAPFAASAATANFTVRAGCAGLVVGSAIDPNPATGATTYAATSTAGSCAAGTVAGASSEATDTDGFLNFSLSARTAFHRLIATWTVDASGRTSAVIGNCTATNLSSAFCGVYAFAGVTVQLTLLDLTNGSVVGPRSTPHASQKFSLVSVGTSCVAGVCPFPTYPTSIGAFGIDRTAKVELLLPALVAGHVYRVVTLVTFATEATCEVSGASMTGCRAYASVTSVGAGVVLQSLRFA